MKQLSIIVRKEKLEDVKEAILKYSSGGMTVCDVIGCGTFAASLDSEGLVFTPEMTRDVHLTSKIRFDVVVHDHEVEELMNKICDAAETGQFGDGKIFVTPIERAVRIRTREWDAEAL